MVEHHLKQLQNENGSLHLTWSLSDQFTKDGTKQANILHQIC